MLNKPIKQENKLIRTPQVIDLTSSCSGGECPKRDECIHYQNYLKLEDKSKKTMGVQLVCHLIVYLTALIGNLL